MRGLSNAPVLPIAASGICGCLLIWWLAGSYGSAVDWRLPGQDGVPTSSSASTVGRELVSGGEPVAGDGKPSVLTGSWSGFRGHDRSGIANDSRQLARTWPQEGPPVLWSIELGEGYAGAAVSGAASTCSITTTSIKPTPSVVSPWMMVARSGGTVTRGGHRNHGMSRTVPAIVDNYVITIGPRCHVACWDATTGDCHWMIDLVRDYGATEPRWYTGQCPLIDQGRLILAPCGEAMLLAVDYPTGEVLWKSPNPRGWQMTHASVMPMDYDGQRWYVYCGSGGVAAVTATVVCCGIRPSGRRRSPRVPRRSILPDGQIFLCSGYGRTLGSLMLRVQASGDQLVPTSVFTLTPEKFNSEHHTPIVFGDHLYGVRKRGGGQLVCLDLQGAELWNSGADRFGHGPYLIADGILYVMDDHGGLTMADASPVGYHRLGRYEVFADGHDAWGPMAIVQGRLIVRDMTRMTCVDVSQR